MTAIKLSQITANPDQPRKTFPQEHIEQLAASIKEHGLLQPIVLRRDAPGVYTIVAGECRYRAHKLLGAETIRAEIVEISDEDTALHAIIENVQRRDMNPMEEAHAFKRLLDMGLSIQMIVQKLGFKGRDRVQNRLNLLDLAAPIQSLVASGNLTTSMASAIALAPPEHQSRVVREISHGTLKTVDQVRHAGQALRDAAEQIDAFADAPIAKPDELAAVTHLERKIAEIVKMVIEGFKEGECVVAQRVRPDRVKTMADQLGLIRKHVLDMEHQLRCVAAQTELLNVTQGTATNEDHFHQATVGFADRQRSKGRRKPNVADKVSRPRSHSREPVA
jgi:ParB family chromosome partitioning protein